MFVCKRLLQTVHIVLWIDPLKNRNQLTRVREGFSNGCTGLHLFEIDIYAHTLIVPCFDLIKLF